MSGFMRIAVLRRLFGSMGAGLLVCLPVGGQERPLGGERLPPESIEGVTLKYCDNPYAGVDWDSIEYLHSVSHQHSGHSEREIMRTLDALWQMGIRHFPLSNYYPSRPIYPLPADFLAKYPAALTAPNAEHAAFNSGDFNGLGSFYTAGSPWSRGAPVDGSCAPFEAVFSNLTVCNPENDPWRGIYTVSVNMEARDQAAGAWLTVEGARAIQFGTYELQGDGIIRDYKLMPRQSGRFVRVESLPVRVRVDFEPEHVILKDVVIKQMGWRPWPEAFRAALDGARRDAGGNPIEGLIYPDAGGITLNHPAEDLDFYLPKLDFDPRVLGIEVWNAHFGFGVNDSLHFYRLWDSILSSGRRCYGFFVKDHFLARPGRNVLLVPPSAGLDRGRREHHALRAYRAGAFFGLLGAVVTDERGVPAPPFDFSQFRFANIAVTPDDRGRPAAVTVAVAGHDQSARPQLQMRFITEAGTALVVNESDQAVFPLPRNAAGAPACRFVRIEAFAFPPKLRDGASLTPAQLAGMDVREIARLHDWNEHRRNPMPIPVADMIFSQPIRMLDPPNTEHRTPNTANRGAKEQRGKGTKWQRNITLHPEH